MSNLTEDTITFGKYINKTVTLVLKDRKYCEWLLKQPWFSQQYEYLYNRVKNYKPSSYFLTLSETELQVPRTPKDFLEKFPYFHLQPIDKLEIELSEEEKVCYKYYLEVIESLRKQLEDRSKDHLCYPPNPFAITAPSRWLDKFEKTYKIPRETFKTFLATFDLLNIPYIIEAIKKAGGLDYKGARSYLIAKEKSLNQEKFWETKLKAKYGEDIGSQFKFKGCIFDFIRIKTGTLYECKLGLKDFNEEQYERYKSVLDYNVIYLIGEDTIINTKKETVYTLDKAGLEKMLRKTENKFIEMVRKYKAEQVTESELNDHL